MGIPVPGYTPVGFQWWMIPALVHGFFVLCMFSAALAFCDKDRDLRRLPTWWQCMFCIGFLYWLPPYGWIVSAILVGLMSDPSIRILHFEIGIIAWCTLAYSLACFVRPDGCPGASN